MKQRLGADRRTRKLQERAYEKMLERNRGLEEDWEGDRLAQETLDALLEDDTERDHNFDFNMWGIGHKPGDKITVSHSKLAGDYQVQSVSGPDHANCRCIVIDVQKEADPPGDIDIESWDVGYQ